MSDVRGKLGAAIQTMDNLGPEKTLSIEEWQQIRNAMTYSLRCHDESEPLILAAMQELRSVGK